MFRLLGRVSAVSLIGLLSACTGAGSPPSLPSQAAPTTTARTGTLTFSIAVPGRASGSGAHRRMPAYVSASTSQVSITVQGQGESAPESAQVFPCSSVCVGSFAAPAGADRVSLALLDSSGKALSTGVTTVLVFGGETNTFSFTLDGVVKSVDLTVSSATLPVVPAQSGYVLFNARDADGNIITYDGHYADANGTPLVFDLASSSTSFTLALTTVSAPGTLIPYAYDGTAHVGKITLTPSAHSGTATTATFTPSTVTLVPGIARQIDPPLSISVAGAMQIPFGTGLAFDPSAIYIVGNGNAGAQILAFTPSTGAYASAHLTPDVGPATVPIVTGPGIQTGGISGFTVRGSDTFSSYYASLSSVSLNANVSSPCNGANDTPFGGVGVGGAFTVACYAQGVGSTTFDYIGAFTKLASGIPRKATVYGTSTYTLQTIDTGGVEVWTESGGATGTIIAGATNYGYDLGGANPNFSFSDGTIRAAAGGAMLAKFSAAPTMFVSDSPAFFAMEGQSFGYVNGSTLSETGPLAIGTPFELLIGPTGTPYILETSGRIDQMAI